MTKRKQKKVADPAEMTEAERALFDAQDRERWEASARHIIDSDNILALFTRELHKVIAGEELNAKLLYLIGTSRLLDRTMHAALKGTSAGGKSEIRNRVLAFFPPESVIAFTSLTEKALIYDERDYRHKILSMAEASATEEQSFQDYLLRELISEGRIRHSVPAKIGKEIITQTVEKEGPVSFIVTTTKGKLHPENETRLLSLEIDDTEKQTKAVLKKVAEVEGLDDDQAAINYAPWHDFQRWLEIAETRNVVVPFADALALAMPPASVRLRRDFGQILRAIKAHALLHRHHRYIDDQNRILADIEHDYATVRGLMNALIAEGSGVAVRPGLQETIDAVALATADLPHDDGASALAIGKLLKLDKSAARRRLLGAASEGFIVNLETRRGQPGRYRATGQKIEAVELLPLPEALEAQGEGLPPVPPCHPTENAQVFEIVSGCATGGTVAAISDEEAAFEERAAILQFDAGLSREEAEAEATRALYDSLGDIPPALDRRSKQP